MSIEDVLTSAEDADISVAEDHDQNQIEKIHRSLLIILDTENILITPSRFKVKRPLFSPSPKCKKVAKIDSPNTMSLKKTIKNLQQRIRRKDKKIKNLVGLIASMSSK